MTSQEDVPKEGMNATQQTSSTIQLDFDQTIKAEIRSLRVLAAYLLPDAQAVDDIVQLTLIRAYEQWDDLKEGYEAGPWLRTILRYMVKTELKQRKRLSHNLNRYRDLWLCTLGEAIEEEELESDHDVYSMLDGCKEKLQPHSKDLIEQRYEQNLSSDEIAKLHDRNVSWVTTTLSRVRRSLKTCIEQQQKES